MTSADSLSPPIARRSPVTRSFHGHSFVDNYEWLRDKDSPETREYLEAENAFTEQETQHLKPLVEEIYQEIKSRIKETDMSVPQRDGDYWYYGRTIEGKSYGLSCRIPVDKEADPWTPPSIPEDSAVPGEQVILDLNALAQGHEFFSLGASSVSTSGRLLAYAVDTAGDERFDLFIKDLETGELLPDRLEGIYYGATWVGDEYIFYQRVDEAWRPDSVWRHKVGADPSEDVLVFREEDQRFFTGVWVTRSEKFLCIESASKLTSETRVLSMDDPEGEFRVLWPRESNVDYSVDHAVVAGVDRFLVVHNATGINYALGECAADVEHLPSLRQLRELLPHDERRRIGGVDTYRDFVLLGYREGAISRAALMQLSPDGYTSFEELEFPEELYTAGFSGNPEWEAPVVRLHYVSFTTPAQLYDLHVASGTRTLLKEQEVQGGYDPGHYVASRLWAQASDGTEVPVSVVHRADLDTTGPHPTVLYAYGSYESSIDPGFSVSRLSLLDRGIIFAVAHVRGGGEMGRQWYDDGKQLRKKNTFTDFISCADALVGAGLSSYDSLVAEGGSAGGMLMGAIANLAPEKFAGVQAIVPFVDPLTSMLKPELPLTVTEWDEWGDPFHDQETYEYMSSYSPYENVEAKRYPKILAITSLNDTRVLYVEPAKWIAHLRATAGSFNLPDSFLLKTEMSAGHGGVSGRYARWRQTAFEYAWTAGIALNIGKES